MKMKSKVTSSIVGLMLGAASLSAHAAAAIALGDDNYTFANLNSTDIETAEREALEGCRKKATNCRIFDTNVGPAAIAIAKGDDGLGLSARSDPQEALSHAMATCKKEYRNCKPTVVYWEEGMRWAALAYAVEDNSAIARFYAYNMGSKSTAEAAALEGCAKQLPETKKGLCKIRTSVNERHGFAAAFSNSAGKDVWRENVEQAKRAAMEDCKRASKPGDTCTIDVAYENHGPQPKPKNFDAVYAKTVVGQEERIAAQQTKQQIVRTNAVQRVTCENKCVNGDCIRTFPDGRKERWQAPRVYDALSRDWKWDTSSCGG